MTWYALVRKCFLDLTHHLIHFRLGLTVYLINDDIKRLFEFLLDYGERALVDRATVDVNYPKQGVAFIDYFQGALLVFGIVGAEARRIQNADIS